MMRFKERNQAKTTANVVQKFVPTVGITSEALAKMSIYVKECSDEIGWMGTAYKDEASNTIFIDDVYLFDQDVHGATTEITPEGLSDFAEELLSKGDEGIEIWNNLKMWGHSHVNMDIFPSGQDNAQMETFKEGGHDWFIRLIANKKGEMKLDLYDYRYGIAYIDLKWIEIESKEEREIKNAIEALYAELDALEAVRLAELTDPIKEEMKQKVRKIGYQNKTGHGYYVNGRWVGAGNVSNKTLKEQQEEEKKSTTSTSGTLSKEKTTTSTTSSSDGIDRAGFYDGEDVFQNDDEVIDHFTMNELLELAENNTFADLESDLELYGYYNYFTERDVERIFRVMRKVEAKFGEWGR